MYAYIYYEIDEMREGRSCLSVFSHDHGDIL